MANHPQPRLTDHGDGDLARYRALSASAVVGLMLGLLSASALLAPLLWTVPLAGILVSGFALRRIAVRDPALLGRKAALAGLTLAILFGAAAVAEWYTYRYMLRREARQFADAWFQFIARDELHKAYQLSVHPRNRKPLDENLRNLYLSVPKWREDLQEYRQDRLIARLLELGETATVQHYETSEQGRGSSGDQVSSLYTVSYQDAGRQQTLFVRFVVERVKLENRGANWWLVHMQEEFAPKGQ